MSVRTLERSIIRSQCQSTKEFRESWKRYHDAKIEKMRDASVTNHHIAKPKPKKNHFDNGRLAIIQWNRMKEYFANLKTKKDESSSESSD